MANERWSYSTGIRGLSRVRVYERVPGGPIQVEGTGLKRQTLTNLGDVPVTDRNLAAKIANRLSERMAEGKQAKAARKLFGVTEPRTVEELLSRYHRDMEGEWGELHRRQQRQRRAWWTEALGGGTKLADVDEATVEAVVRFRLADKADQTRRKYLAYIRAAFTYARRKLKWIREEGDLSGVKMPRPSRGGPSYSHDEMMALLRAAPDVSPEVSAALEVAYDTQARSRAILHLKPSDHSDGLLRFRAKYDKAGKERVAALSRSARARVEALVEENPGRSWLFEKDGRRMDYDTLLRLLRAVEEAAGVPRVEGRGWHAVKRRSVTDARKAAGDMGVVARQSGTLASTLERVYEQDDLAPKQALAEALEKLRRDG